MAKVNVPEQLPVLKADMFPKAEIIPFTITKVSRVPFDRKTRYVLTSKEHGEHVLWLNTHSVRALVTKFGDDDDNWIGQTVPLVKTRTENPRSGDAVLSLWVAGADDISAWETIAGESATPKRKRGGR